MSEYIVRIPPDMPYEIRAELNAWYVESEPIVRCRDCKHTRKSWNGKRPDFVPDGFFCAYWGGHQLWKPDGYCAWGERSTE